MKPIVTLGLCLTLSVQALAGHAPVRLQTIENDVTSLFACIKESNTLCEEEKFDSLITRLENAQKEEINPLKIEKRIKTIFSKARNDSSYDSEKLDFYQGQLEYFFNTEAISSSAIESKVYDFVSCLKSNDQCEKTAVKNLANILISADKANIPKDELADIVFKITKKHIKKGDVDKERLQRFSDLLDEELREGYTSFGQDAAAYTLGAAIGGAVVLFVAINAIGVMSNYSRGTSYSHHFTKEKNLGYGAIAILGSILTGVFVTGPMAVELSDSMSNSMQLHLSD